MSTSRIVAALPALGHATRNKGHLGRNKIRNVTATKQRKVNQHLSWRALRNATAAQPMKPDQGARFEVHFQKNRGFFGQDAEPFECHLIDGERWNWMNFCDSVERQIDALRDTDPKISQAEIARRIGCHPATVSRAIARMKRK